MENLTPTLPRSREDAVFCPALDVCRVGMALMVLAIHFPPLLSVSRTASVWLSNGIVRLAVPFFFCCNGYFLYRASAGEKRLEQSIRAAAQKTLRMYLFWTAVYAPIIIMESDRLIRSGKRSLLKQAAIESFKFLFMGGYYHLWYLHGVLTALLMLWLFRVRWGMSWRNMTLLAAVLFAVGVLFIGHYGWLEAWPVWERLPSVWYRVLSAAGKRRLMRHGVFFGFPGLLVGIQCARRKHTRPAWGYAAGFAGMLVALGGEEALSFRFESLSEGINHDMYFLLLPTVYVLLCALLTLGSSKSDTTRELRKFSSLFYFLHRWIILIYRSFYHRVLGDPVFRLSAPIGYAVVALATTLCALWILRLSRCPKLRWMKRFY